MKKIFGKFSIAAWGVLALGLVVLAVYSFLGLIDSFPTDNPHTLGDVARSEGNGKSMMFSIALASILAAGIGYAFFATNKIKTAFNAGFAAIAAIGIVGAAVVGFSSNVDNTKVDYLKLQSVDPDNKGWENYSADVVMEYFDRDRINPGLTADELIAKVGEEKAAEMTKTGENFFYQGKPLDLGNDTFVRQQGASFMCVFDSKGSLDGGETDKCVRMDRSISDYRGYNESELEAIGFGESMMLSLGMFAPLSLFLGIAGYPSAKRGELKTAAQIEAALKARWDNAVEIIDTVSVEWGELAGDPLNVLDHSALLDSSQERTKKFILALGQATDFKSTNAKKSKVEVNVNKVEELAHTVKVEWDSAYTYSKQVGTTWMTPAEQKTANLARKLLTTALDDRTPIEERATAAAQAQKQLDKLVAIKMPQVVMLRLEAVAMKELTA